MSEELQNTAGDVEVVADDATKKSLTSKDLRKSFLYWVSLTQATYSYERMQAPGFMGAMAPAIQRLYPDETKDKEQRAEACKRHMEFFNTEPWMIGPGIVGLTLSLEEEKANGVEISGEDINGVKTSLMGPCAGIGDTLRQATLIPVIGSICIALGQGGSFFAPILYLLLTLGINYGIAYWLFKFAYKKGKSGVGKLFASGKLEQLMTMATTMGAICLGGMASSNIKLSSTAVLQLGENTLEIQSLFDKVFTNLLPFGVIMFTYYLLKKKNVSSLKTLGILAVLAVVLVLVGFM